MKYQKIILLAILWITLFYKQSYPQTDTVMHKIPVENVVIMVDSTQNAVQQPQDLPNKKENKRILIGIALLTLTIFLIYNVRSN